MQRQAALVNLALAFILIFGTAFSCGQGNNRRTSSTNIRPDRNDSPTSSDSEKTDRARGDLPNLAGGWLVISQTTRGDTEKPSSVIMGCIVFARGGTWNYGHNGGSAEGGTYKVSGSRLVMTGDDRAIWGDFRLSSRTSRDLFLESTDQLMHLRYKDSNGCG